MLPVSDGPTHEYIGASPACWSIYGSLLADEYGRFNMPPAHKFTVDAYAIQHPGVDERRSRQSVAAHAVRLCLMLERGHDQRFATRLMSRAVNGTYEYPWFDVATPIGSITVDQVVGAETLDDHTARLRGWASDVWSAYEPHHELIGGWCDRLESETL